MKQDTNNRRNQRAWRRSFWALRQVPYTHDHAQERRIHELANRLVRAMFHA